MLLKNLLNYKLYRCSRACVYVKKCEALLWNCELATAAFEKKFPCLRHNRNYSTSYLSYTKKTQFVKLLTANISSSSNFTPKKEQSLKRVDQVPEDFSLIYKATMDNYIVYGRRLATISIIFLFGVGITKGCHLLPLTLLEIEMIPKSAYTEDSYIKSERDFLLIFMSFVAFVSALQTFASKIPLRLYHNPVTDEYIAIFSNFFGFPWKLYFNKAQAKKLKPSGILPWRDDKFSIQSRKVVLFEHYFRFPADYNALLGIEIPDNSS